MNNALLSYFLMDDTLYSVCDFNPFALENGTNIYEVLRVIDGKPLFLEDHVQRFFHSLKMEKLSISLNEKQIKARIKTLISENKFYQGNLKFLYNWGPSGSQHFIAMIIPFYYPSPDQYQKGVEVGIMLAERTNPNAKKMMKDLREKADKWIKTKKCYEVLYLSNKGLLTEGSRSNLFFINDNNLITPKVSMVLPGVTRSKLIEIAKKNNDTVVEKNIPFNEISDYQSCFLSGTSPKVLPVKSIEGHYYDINAPFLRFLMDAYDQLCFEYLEQFSW